MSVFFLHPLYLFGLFAASLPILIHLLNRRRLKRIRFPAVRFIVLSQKRISRSYRLRHWLLLALRTLAVILLVLLLANPIFQTGAGLFAGGGPVSMVILLDNSLSMTWSGDGVGFKEAKEAARLLINALNDGDRAAVIPTNISEREHFRLKEEKGVLLRDLEAVEIADGTANLSVALAKAYELLNPPAGQKQIRLITDMGLTGWDQFSISDLKQYDPSIPLKTIRIGAARRPLNGTVKEVKTSGDGVGVNMPIHVEAVLANFGAAEITDLLVQLRIDGELKEQKLARLPARGEASVKFQTTLAKAGAHTGEITLKKDGFAGNPRAYFALHAQDKLHILLVDGDPQTALVNSETFFLARALNPAGDPHSSLYLPTVIIADGLSAAALESYQVVVLCNVAAISDTAAQNLHNFVRQGGGVLIFGGDRLQADNYNQKLSQILPARLRERKAAVQASAEKIGRIDMNHPALRSLADPLLRESLSTSRVWGYVGGDASGKAALISLSNGDALFSEQKVGTGRIVFIGTSADRDWTDLPIKTAYLPLVQSITDYLAGGRRGALDSGIEVGRVKEITLAPGAVGKNLGIVKPDKQQVQVSVVADQDRSLARIEENNQAGFYRISAPRAAEQEASAPPLYAVNAPFLESRLDEISERELQAKLRPVQVEVIPVEALSEGGKRMDLAFPLLVLLGLTLLVEGWLAQRF